MSDENDSKRFLLPASAYRVKCVDHAWGFTSKDKEQIGLQLQIVEGDHAGKLITYYGFFTDKTEEHSLKAMRALGWVGNDIQKMESMYTKEAMAVVEHETDDDGQLRARVRWINGVGVMMQKRMEGADLAKFGKRISGLAARLASGGGGTSTGAARLGSVPNDGVPPPADDDMPPWAGGRGR